MLTGEWGCGKTYLLNNDLKKELKDSHIFLRISLFGVGSIEEIKSEVKRRWFNALFNNSSDEQKHEKIRKFGGVARNITGKVAGLLPGTAKTVVESALSINVLDFVSLEPQIGEKKVVLIFDDLERCNIPTTELLGCINDYCENIGISTIIVANEKRMKDDVEEKIRYNDIKEKIIQRTIQHIPNYHSIVKSIVDDMVFKSESYKTLLLNNIDEIEAIFSGTTIEGNSLDTLVQKVESGNSREEIDKKNEQIAELLVNRPHNIRSLKCALQDFSRVYQLLVDYNMEYISKWLFSFVAYVFTSRAGLIKESKRYGDLFSTNNVSTLYPGFYDEKYITHSVKKWIRTGEWNKDDLIKEISFIKQRDSAIKPEDKVRTNYVFDLEETDIIQGFPLLLEKAYSGQLCLDEYVTLLCNYSWARKYKINIANADWGNVYDGVEICIDELVKNHAEPSHFQKIIGDDSKEDFLPEEWKVYELIRSFRDEDKQTLENNKSLYIETLKKEPAKAFSLLQNKRFDCFDMEMAVVTLEAFRKSNNSMKHSLISVFKNIWRTNMGINNSSTDNFEENLEGFLCLKAGLEEYLKECNNKDLSVAAYHTNRFIEIIDSLLRKENVERN